MSTMPGPVGVPGPVAVVVPALDEEATIAAVVGGFRAQSAVTRVIVVDNDSRDGTAAAARAAGATLIVERSRGYGAALRAGIEHAVAEGAERVVLAEADGTFDPAEIGRLLEPLAQHALVLGSRSASMTGALGLGNRAVARVLAALWPRAACRLSDVGCTYRAFTRETWRILGPGTPGDGPEFSPQMICEAFRHRLRVLEIRVRYLPRLAGTSKHTGAAWLVARTALRMLRAILAKRCERAPRAH